MSNVIWITGLSAAGKTTLANLLQKKLRDQGRMVVMLDGDELRNALNIAGEHGQEARLSLAFKYAGLARLIASQGVIVVVSAVALFHEIHKWNRKNLPGYFEVFLKVSIEELRRRDPKGLYRRFDRGELNNVAGLDMIAEEPIHPDLTIEYQPGLSPEVELGRLMAALAKVLEFKSPPSPVI